MEDSMTEKAKADPKQNESGKKEEKEEKLPVCDITSTPEHARLDDDMEPCDDGRSGK